ncbi:MAG: MASE3 domain-containing protein, partial [Promethearchaeia archaeon]
MRLFSSYKNAFIELGAFSLILLGIALTRFYNYLLFHSLAESFSIVIATVIFIIAWTMRKEIDKSFFLVLGVSSLFIGFLDIIHTLTYPGMSIIAEANTNLASQFWIATRYLQVLSIVGSIWAINKNIKPNLLLGIYILITGTLIILIFFGFFPTTYTEGEGLTPFKIISEYVIILILFVAIILLYDARNHFEKDMYFLINAFLAAFIISEFFFTLYFTPYAHMNLIGHIVKIIAFYFLYKSIIQISLKNPLQLLFRKLNLSRNKFKDAYNRADFLMHLIAHDIKNILQVINLQVEMCRMSMKDLENADSLESDLKVIE